MEKYSWRIVLILILILLALLILNYYVSKPRENFAMESVCATGLPEIIKRAMGLMDGDNSLPGDLLTKCIIANDFKKLSDTGLLSRSSVLTVLYNLFQTTDSTGIPYIDKFFDWKLKNSSGTQVPVDWSARLDQPGTTTFQKTVELITITLIPMIINLRRTFSEIASNTELSAKYNSSANAANREFINGFLDKYKDFDESSPGKLRTNGTEENALFRALTDRIDYRDPIITSNPLKNAMKDFAFGYLLKVNFKAAPQCNINLIDNTPVDNDVKLYIRLKTLFEIWRKMGKSSTVAFTATDLNSSTFQTQDDYSKSALIKYFTEELRKPTPTGIIIEDHMATTINKMVNDTFITDGGLNDGHLINDPECKSDVGKLLCDLKLDNSRICQPNMDACLGSPDFNKYCTAVSEILKSTTDSTIKPLTLNLNNLPTTPTTTTRPSGGAGNNITTTTTQPSGGAGNNITTTTTTATTQPSGGAGIPGAESQGVGAPLSAGATGSAGSISSELQSKLTQYSIPSYLDRGTQELLVFVFDKLAASYNFDDEDVPDDIKQAISQLSPSGKASLCARYCQLTSRCNGICKLAGCLNCQVGTGGAQAGSEMDGAADTTLGYAGVDDDYNLLGFLDDISKGGNPNEIIDISGGFSTNIGGGFSIPFGLSEPKDQYKHMGPMISQKDTSGVSNIFAPYIIMAPKKDDSTYGAYLLDDPNDPNYQQYINDLVKSY